MAKPIEPCGRREPDFKIGQQVRRHFAEKRAAEKKREDEIFAVHQRQGFAAAVEHARRN